MAIKDIANLISPKPEMREIAINETDNLYKHWKLSPYNPDEMIMKKGYKIIKKMMSDAHVRGCMNTLKMSTLSSGWEFNAGSDESRDVEIRDFVVHNIDEVLKGSFYSDLMGILNGLENGWSLSEKNFVLIKSGKYAGKIGLESIKDKNPAEYNLNTDDYGNVIGISNIGLGEDYGKEDYPVDKFIIHTFWKKYENIFGELVLRAVYRHWWSKDNIIKFWNIHLNKWGVPTAVAKYPRGATKKEQDEVKDVIQSIQTQTGIVIPEEFAIELLEAKRRGDAGFLKAVNFHNSEISKAILGQTLTSEQGDVGSYSLGKVHFNILVFYVVMLQKVLEEVVNEQVIRQLVDYNYPNVENYPKMAMKSIVEEDKQKQVELYIKAVKDGIVKIVTIDDENHVRDLLGFADRELTDREKQAIEEASKIIDENASPQPPANTGAVPTPEEDLPPTKEFAEQKKLRRKFTVFEERVDFVEVINTIEDTQEKATKDLSAIVRKQVDDVELQIQRKDLINKNTNVREIEKLSVRFLVEMRKVLREAMQLVYTTGRVHARQEVNKGKQMFAAADLELTGIPPNAMLKELDSMAFAITGGMRDDILKSTKNRIYNSRKTGKTLKETVHLIEQDMDKYLETGVLKPDKDGVLRVHTPARIETIVRTNVNDAYNEGRMSEFRELGDEVPALQYSAILDSRTRLTHADMDGRIYPKDDPIWDIWQPANGYNCRCITVAVLKEEKYEVSDKPTTVKSASGKDLKVEPDKGFE